MWTTALAASSDNTSATGSYLAPVSPSLADDLGLDLQLQGLIAGLTGLPDTHVFPRWQEEAPRLPDLHETWAAVGVTEETPADSPSLRHDGAGEGSSVLRSTYRVEVLASLYGPRSNAYARLIADSLWLGQNREAMARQGLFLMDVGALRRAPEIIAARGRRRTDLPFTLTRVVERIYPIRNLRQAVGTIHAADTGPTSPTASSEPFAIPET